MFRESRSVCELLKHCTRQQRSTIDYFLHIHMSPTTATTASGVPARANRLKPVCILVLHLLSLSHTKDYPYVDSSGTMECARQCVCDARREHLQW